MIYDTGKTQKHLPGDRKFDFTNCPVGSRTLETYNYETFPLDMHPEVFENFPSVMKAGEKAPDGELIDAATGESVRLSELWSQAPLMIEFGAIT